jgi:hypothetical protein
LVSQYEHPSRPLRLNLIKPGLGGSAGGNALRARIDATPYAAGSRGRLYYSERILIGDRRPVRHELPRSANSAPVAWTVATVLARIFLLLLLGR